MRDDAKMTMLLYADLSPDEQAKLERLDNALSGVLLGAGVTDRAIWTSATETGQRVIRLCTGKRTLLAISSSELISIPDNTLLSRLQTALSRAG
jgi:hypothetical protein